MKLWYTTLMTKKNLPTKRADSSLVLGFVLFFVGAVLTRITWDQSIIAKVAGILLLGAAAAAFGYSIALRSGMK